MADCGATASFIDSLFAQLHGLKLIPLQHPRDLTVADGKIISSGAITHTVRIALALGGTHHEVLKLFITTLGQYPVVLGLPWLRKHDPRIHSSENIVTFDSKYCLEHCITTSSHQAMTIRGADNTFDTLHEHETHCSTAAATAMPRPNTATVAKHCLDPTVIDTAHEIHESHETYKTPQTHETHETHRSTVPKPQYSSRSSHCIDMADCTRKINRELTLLDNPIVTEPIVTKSAGAARQPTESTATSATSRPLDISMIGAAPFNRLVQHSQSRKGSGIQIFSVTLRDINIALAPKKHTNPAIKLPSDDHDFLDVFSRSDADVLPKHRPRYDHAIKIMESKTPTWGPLYSMSADELKVLKTYIEKMVDKGFIRASSLSAASPVLFAKKPGGGLRFCVDY